METINNIVEFISNALDVTLTMIGIIMFDIFGKHTPLAAVLMGAIAVNSICKRARK